MATYNRAHFIVETLAAIQKQTHINWECLIIDDGGTDNTLEVISPILEVDPRFSFLKRPNSYGKGLPGCRNYGIDTATGDYIIFFDDDDIPHPQNLEICLNELKDSSFKFCRYLRAVFFGEFDYKFDSKNSFGKVTFTHNDLSKMIDHTISFNSCAVLWSKSCFEKNRFNETLMYAEEWECYSRILSEKIKGVCIEKTLFYGRKHANSNTGEFWKKNPVRQNSKKEAIRLIMENLRAKNLLTSYLFTYLSGLAISFRDRRLIDDIIKRVGLSLRQKIILHIKYTVYPIWVAYKRLLKTKKPKNVI
ncbi:Glycosyltransferase involved in cell wall bisynthesis [Ulvibacter litoralis]|uniref:Glycosyltransferase involved in cell wall bisynthesis n=2 Tax=Ulvibacter litoralis TaxID=227084 RepID=A0A1G7GVD2_9FLAO|nr:hypothetical protein GCM10008083_26210 [Ulvibacter litoralis]SDE92061.1 Glycosyltransferase involved in cell wall bisynthesis [Ulvibacter litoralis]